MKLVKASEENILRYFGFEEKYIVGKSPVEKLKDAARLEYETGVKPLVTTEENSIRNYAIESYASNILIYAMEKNGKGRMERCPDSCLADVIFSPDKDSDNFIGIQIKSTSKKYKTSGWYFAMLGKKYDGFLMFFRSLTDGKGWLIPYNILIKFYSAEGNILIAESKKTLIDWKKYEVTNQNVISKVYEYYNSEDVLIQNEKSLTTPIFKNHELEQKTRNNFEHILLKMNLGIKRPELENMSYDFILGELKIQEKIGMPDKSQDIRIPLYKRKGKELKPYKKGIFGILLIHLKEPNEKLFYFIPEDKLLEQEFINTDEHEGNFCFMVYPTERKMIHNKPKKEWSNEFLLHHEDPNLTEKMLGIYYKQLNHNKEPVELINPILWNIKCENINDLIIKWCLKRTYPIDNNKINFILNGKKIVYRILTNNKGKEKKFRLNISYSNKTPYRVEEFDYVICKTPENFDHLGVFYIFPSHILLKNNILKTDLYKGKYEFEFPDPSLNYRSKYSWVNNFIFKYDDSDFKNTLLNFFEKDFK